jgi:hypothetical protein
MLLAGRCVEATGQRGSERRVTVEERIMVNQRYLRTARPIETTLVRKPMLVNHSTILDAVAFSEESTDLGGGDAVGRRLRGGARAVCAEVALSSTKETTGGQRQPRHLALLISAGSILAPPRPQHTRQSPQSWKPRCKETIWATGQSTPEGDLSHD